MTFAGLNPLVTSANATGTTIAATLHRLMERTADPPPLPIAGQFPAFERAFRSEPALHLPNSP